MDHLLTEARNPASLDLDGLTSLEIVRLMNAEDAKIAPAVATQALAIARAIDVVAERLAAGGRLIYAGAGTSGRLGVLDASECPPTFNSLPGQVVGIIAGGTPALTTAVEGAEDHPEYAATDLREINLSASDVLVGIATSGRTPYVVGALCHARSVGAIAIGLTCVPDSELNAIADLTIAPLVGAEILAGSTRLKAGTATKLILNMLTTGAMVRLGKTFGNLMVDLRATNTKLRDRTNRIVRHHLGLNVEDANSLLDRCGGQLKTALVVGRSGLSPDQARGRLEECSGRVGEALREVPARVRHPELLLGIDGGGTHTAALLATFGAEGLNVVGRGEGGPSNLHAVGPPAAFAALDHAVTSAFTSAGVERGTVRAATLGLAGAGRPEEQAVVRSWATRVGLADFVSVARDMELPLALLPGGWGVVVVAGTGSSVLARSADGRVARAGGWGPVLGDEGSGYALAVAALRAATREADGRVPDSSLSHRLMREIGVTTASDLVRVVHDGEWDRPRLSSLAAHVIRAADEGDPVASRLIDEQVDGLAECVAVAVDAVGLVTSELAIALSGGLLSNAPTYRDRLLRAIYARGLRAGHVIAVSEPAEGALRIARALAVQ